MRVPNPPGLLKKPQFILHLLGIRHETLGVQLRRGDMQSDGCA